MSDITTLMMAASGVGGEEAGYQISRSLRFNSADSAYLSRTPASAGNRQKFTWSGWVKKADNGNGMFLINAQANANLNTPWCFISIDGLDYFRFYQERMNQTVDFDVKTAAVFRDVGAWYHLVCAVDTTQATASNRVKLYVNGVQQTNLTTADYPTQNFSCEINNTVPHTIQSRDYYLVPTKYFNGYMAEVHHVDGQALTPSDFGETDATTGVWKPKEYTGTYGTNGFYLDFSDNTSTTTLGEDQAGSNDWTLNNFSVTAGANNDSLVDTPTPYGTDTGAGGEVRGNYCTWNAASISADATLTNGGLDVAYGTSATRSGMMGTFGMSSGKWYWEITITASSISPSRPLLGITNKSSASDSGLYVGANANGWGYYGDDGDKYNNSVGAAYGASYTTNDVIGFAFDADVGSVTAYKNGVSQGVMYSSLPAGTYFPAISDGSNAETFSASANFGQRPFAYTAPSGFKALCTQNLDEGTITTSGTFTGNGSTNGPFVYLNGVPTAMTIDGNAVTFGTHADKLANGFKVRSSSASYNANATSMSYTISTTGAKFKYANAQPNP